MTKQYKINMEKKMKKKRVVKIAIWLIVLAVLAKGCCVYYTYEKEKERLEQRPYFTKYKLTASEMSALDCGYHMKITPDIQELSEEEQLKNWPDFSYFTIEATEDTEVVITVLNYWLFDDRIELAQEAWDKAEEYGITTDNRLTVEWVMNNPKKAAKIMNSMPSEGDTFRYLKKRIYPVYEKITGIPMEKYKP